MAAIKKVGSGRVGSGRTSVTGDGPRASYAGQDGEEKIVYINPSSLASGGIAEKAAAIFRVYDPNNKNMLEHDSMMQALAELGVINGLTSKKLTEILSIGSDSTIGKNRSYTLQEFVSFYERLAHYQAKAARQERIKALSKMPTIPDGVEGNETLKLVFLNYCKYTVGSSRSNFDEQEPKMSSTQFVKLSQDLGLVQPSGPLNVVTVDVIFHKAKPQGGRRLLYQNYLKALSASAEESNMNVFELIGLLGQQIQEAKPSKQFIAPQPVVYRQETRTTELAKVKLMQEAPPAPQEDEFTDDDSELPEVIKRAPREQHNTDDIPDEFESPVKPKKGSKDKKSSGPSTPKNKEAQPSKDKDSHERVDAPTNNEPAPSLYSMGVGGKSWLACLPDDAPEWMREMAAKMGELEEQVVSANKENYELRQQVKHTLAKSRLANGSGVDYKAFEELARAAGLDPQSVLAAAQQGGAVSGADMASLLVDMEKRLKAMEGGAGGRRGIKGVNREGGEGEEDEEDEFDELGKRVDTLEKQIVEGDEKTKAELKDEIKKISKATKTLPNLESRVAACEAKEEELEKHVVAHEGKIASLEGKVKSLSDGLQAEVTQAINSEMGKNVGAEMARMLAPGGDLSKVVIANVEAAAGDLTNRLMDLEGHHTTANAKVDAMEGLLAEQAAKVEQAFALAQEGMSRQVANAPKLQALDDWTKIATSLETSVKELQQQVKDLQAKNTSLEAEVEGLKKRSPETDGLRSETMVHAAAPGGEGGDAGSLRRGLGTSEMIHMAELSGMVQGLQSALKDTQAGLATALTAVGFTPADAAKEGAAATAATRKAAQEAAISELTTRMESVEHRQQEATGLLKKAEALLSGPAAGLAAMNAASAAAASAANARKEESRDKEAIAELVSRLTVVENRQKEAQNAVSSAMSACAVVPALETALNTKLPNLENIIRNLEVNHKTLVSRIDSVDQFDNQIRTKLPELDTALKVAETRVNELERKANNADRMTRELSDLIKAVQLEQEGMAANVAMSAQLRGQQGAGGGNGGVDPATLQLVMATEERLQRHITKLNEAINNQMSDLDAAKVKYDTNLDMVQTTFEQLHMRLNNMDSGSGDSRIMTYARMTDLREAENSLLDGLRLQGETADRMQRTINQLVADVERIASSYNSSEQARAASNNKGGHGGGLGPEQLQLLESRIEARLALLATQYVTIEALREWELRFVTSDALRTATDKARANDEVILQAVKEVDRQINEKLEISQQVMLRMARQVDVLQNTLRQTPPPDAATSQIKIIKGNQPPSSGPSLINAIPPALPAETGQDPLSILLAQAGAAAPPE